MALVGAFIGIAILLGIGTQILGNSAQDCTTLDDYDATAGATQTGWAASCLEQNQQTQNAYALLNKIDWQGSYYRTDIGFKAL